jgi:2-alkenal reductase
MKARKSWITLLVLMATLLTLSGCWAIPVPDLSRLREAWPETGTPTSTPAATVIEQPIVLVTATPRPVAAPAPAGQELALADLYELVNPSVVNISVVVRVDSDATGMPEIPGLPRFFGPNAPTERYQQGQGSGFVYDDQGHIITNNHVVQGAERVTVTFADDATAVAEVVGVDPDSDLAVIKVEALPAGVSALPIAAADDLKVGQSVVAIGNPFGLSGSMTTGIVSALGRLLPASSTASGGTYTIPNIIQTDAAINPGNSGGPLLNLQGEVVGVNTAIESAGGTFSGVGFVVPASIVRRVVPSLIANGEYLHPWLGVTTVNLSPDFAEILSLSPQQRGVLVLRVTDGSPAARAGVRASNETVTVGQTQVPIGGDIIVGINERAVAKFDDLISYLSTDTSVWDEVTLTILRDGSTIQVQVTLAARPH